MRPSEILGPARIYHTDVDNTLFSIKLKYKIHNAAQKRPTLKLAHLTKQNGQEKSSVTACSGRTLLGLYFNMYQLRGKPPNSNRKHQEKIFMYLHIGYWDAKFFLFPLTLQ